MRWHLLLPFLASVIYVAGALCIRRSAAFHVGALRVTFVSNVVGAIVIAGLLPIGGEPWRWQELWQPALVAALYFAGQWLAFLAIDGGDVSVATPALGAKTIWVAWLSTLLLQAHLPWQLWLAAFLTFAAIVLLHLGASQQRQRIGRTIALSLGAAAAYGCFDVLVQKWAPAWGFGRFLPLTFGLAAVFSCGFIPFFRAPLAAIPRAAWPWLGAGAFLIALQSLCFVSSVAVFGDATAANVVYSARGLWSVVFVWLIGHWFHNQEQQLGGKVLRARLAGAALMTAAIVIALFR